MKHPFGDFFYFSRKEKRGMVILCALIAIAFSAGHLYTWWRNRQGVSEQELRRQADAVAEYDRFLASVRQREKVRRTDTPHTPHASRTAKPLLPQPFNPNTVDSATLCRMGLPSWMARNILRYREKGGRFRRAEDFKKIYGLTEEQYRQLAAYIEIPSEDTVRTVATPLYQPPAIKDSLYKYPAGTLVDLNCADTTELKKIPGIGSGIARLIVSYRQRLGGFYHIEQLQEIHLDSKRLQEWFLIRPDSIRRINLNRAGIERLRRHPYINFYQAKAIVEYRKKKGKLHNLKPFRLYEEFTAAELERLERYVCFE